MRTADVAASMVLTILAMPLSGCDILALRLLAAGAGSGAAFAELGAGGWNGAAVGLRGAGATGWGRGPDPGVSTTWRGLRLRLVRMLMGKARYLGEQGQGGATLWAGVGSAR